MRKAALYLSSIAGVVLLTLIGLSTAVAESPASPSSSGINDNSPWYTSIQIQNPTTETVDVLVEYYDQAGAIVTTSTYDIPAGSTQVIWQNPPPGIPGLPDGFAGSAVILSNGPVLAVVNEVGNGIFGSHNGVSDANTTAYLPLVMRGNYGWDTWFAVQNAGTDTANVTISFYDNVTGNLVGSITDTIPIATSHYYDQTDGSFSWLGSSFVGSAVIVSTQPVAAAVNESNGSTLLTYNGFASGSPTVSLPLIMKDNYGWYTSIQIQNLDSVNTATVEVKYYETGSATPITTTTVSIPPRSVEVFWQNPPPGIPELPSGFVGSAIAECTSGQNIVAIVNEVCLGSGCPAGENSSSYNGFNQ